MGVFLLILLFSVSAIGRDRLFSARSLRCFSCDFLILFLFSSTGLIMNPISERAGICAARNCIALNSDWAEYLWDEKAVRVRGNFPLSTLHVCLFGFSSRVDDGWAGGCMYIGR